jgi:MFS family permease
MSTELSVEQQVQRNYRFNFFVNAVDGALFWCGSSFIASTTILPLYISRLTDSKLAIGILSMISAMGWLVPQLFTANWVQRLPRKKVLPVNLGLFFERLPVMLMAPAALFLATRAPTLALVVFLGLFAWHAFGAGVLAVAWQDMIGKIIPIERRGLFFGVTNFLGTATGVVGASMAAWMLDHYAFPTGYVLTFASSGVLIFVSWLFLAMAREPAQEVTAEPVSQLEFFRRLPDILRADPNFRRYLLSRVVIAFGGMASGFATVYAVQRWALSDGQAGTFTTAILLGQALANLVLGPLADRTGHKMVLEIGALLGAIAIGLAAVVTHANWFYVIFALLGVQTAGFLSSSLMIALEFGPRDLRPTYIGLNNTVSGIAGGLAPIFGGWLAEIAGYRGVFVVALGIGLVGAAMLHRWVREPRIARQMDLQTKGTMQREGT